MWVRSFEIGYRGEVVEIWAAINGSINHLLTPSHIVLPGA